MRFTTFDKNRIEAVGVRVDDETLVDLSMAAPELPRNLLELIRSNNLERAYEKAQHASGEARRSFAGLKYLPVIPRPPKLCGFGANYRSHAGERPTTTPFFLSGPTRLVANNEPIVIPKKSNTLDYETELAVVIGRKAKHVSANQALDHVAGYTIFNDASVRGHGGGLMLTLMKGSDNTGPFGPELVTPEELPRGCNGLTLRTRRNGVIVQEESTANMFWNVAEIIELVSSYMTLEVGDVIATGTCGGTVADTHRQQFLANANDPSLPWLQPGEVIESEIEQIGILRNTIVLESG